MNEFAWTVKVNSMLRQLSNFNGSDVIVVASFACIMFLSEPVFGQNKANSVGSTFISVPNELQMKIGNKLYFEKKQGCATCHGMTGKGADQAKHVDLSRPSSWKSYKISTAINCQKSSDLDVKSVAVELILNGAAKWNENFYETVGLKLPDESLLFDKEMIGIHSSAFKRNVRSIYRILKKNKLRFKSRIIPRVMAQSVFYYISENIFSETLDVKYRSEKCDG